MTNDSNHDEQAASRQNAPSRSGSNESADAETQPLNEAAGPPEDYQENIDGVDAIAGDTMASESLKAELQTSQDKVLRLQAELENFRKRAHRTIEDERRFAGIELMRDLLPVVDNLQRAIEAAEQNHNATALLDGVKMVAEQLIGVLKRHDCEPIPAEGLQFDPHLHETIGQAPSATHPPGTVTHVATVGYRLHDRVVRPSQVLIAAPPVETRVDDSSP